VSHSRSFEGHCNIDGCYVEETSVIFRVSTGTCYWRSKTLDPVACDSGISKGDLDPIHERHDKIILSMGAAGREWCDWAGVVQLGGSGAAALGSAAQVAEKWGAK